MFREGDRDSVCVCVPTYTLKIFAWPCAVSVQQAERRREKFAQNKAVVGARDLASVAGRTRKERQGQGVRDQEKDKTCRYWRQRASRARRSLEPKMLRARLKIAGFYLQAKLLVCP